MLNAARSLALPFLLALSGVHAAEEAPAYQPYFDPAKGFKPAQHNLTKVFLQLAGSLEATGSPEGYIRHVVAEHVRIDAKYKAATGKTGSSRPAYLTDAYIENLLSGWKKLEAPLKLDDLCRESGRNMRYAIMGGWNKSNAELVAQEAKLTDAEKASYQKLLAKAFFAKADFPAMEAFYKDAFDKLTEEGQEQISRRTSLGKLSPEERDQALKKAPGGTSLVATFNDYQDKLVPDLDGRTKTGITSDTLEKALIQKLKLDADQITEEVKPELKYSALIKSAFQRRFDHIKKQAPPEQEMLMREAMLSMVENLLVIAHSEYEAGIYEQMGN